MTAQKAINLIQDKEACISYDGIEWTLEHNGVCFYGETFIAAVECAVINNWK